VRLFLRILLGLVAFLLIAAVIMHLRAKNQRADEDAYHTKLPKTVTLTSPAFAPNGPMPVECSCKGAQTSPALAWRGAPANTRAYALLLTDFDVPSPNFPVFNLSHWTMYNLAASVQTLPGAATVASVAGLGGVFGKNSMGETKYIGPCPPIGQHQYVFRVYALDQPLNFTEVADKKQVLTAMQGHILGYGELVGVFAAQ
jgi:Raf kinase inhibitor-like YbhB/YbcL family protein